MAILIGLASRALFAAAEGAAHAEAAEHKAGMPQLATETFAGQVFWLAISFVVGQNQVRHATLNSDDGLRGFLCVVDARQAVPGDEDALVVHVGHPLDADRRYHTEEQENDAESAEQFPLE